MEVAAQPLPELLVDLTSASLDRLARVARLRDLYREEQRDSDADSPRQLVSLLVQAVGELCHCRKPGGVWAKAARHADELGKSQVALSLFADYIATIAGGEAAGRRDEFEAGFETLGIPWIAAEGLAEQCAVVRSRLFEASP